MSTRGRGSGVAAATAALATGLAACGLNALGPSTGGAARLGAGGPTKVLSQPAKQSKPRARGIGITPGVLRQGALMQSRTLLVSASARPPSSAVTVSARV